MVGRSQEAWNWTRPGVLHVERAAGAPSRRNGAERDRLVVWATEHVYSSSLKRLPTPVVLRVRRARQGQRNLVSGPLLGPSPCRSSLYGAGFKPRCRQIDLNSGGGVVTLLLVYPSHTAERRILRARPNPINSLGGFLCLRKKTTCGLLSGRRSSTIGFPEPPKPLSDPLQPLHWSEDSMNSRGFLMHLNRCETSKCHTTAHPILNR